MEILKKMTENGYVFSFKIDLIVWKSDNSLSMSTKSKSFKIDLIVWK